MLSVQNDISPSSDEALIREYQRTGDKELIGELYRRYHHLVYGACLKFLKDKTESSDLVIVIFEKIIQKLSVTEVHNFNSWLYSLCKNECVNYIRRQAVRRREQGNWLEGEASAEIPTGSDELLHLGDSQLQMEEEEANDASTRVRTAIAKLAPEQRICISLFFLKEQSYQQIAENTSYSLLQVKSYLQNGKRNLKKLLEEDFS